MLIGQRVKLRTRDGDVVGVIGRKPIHLLKDEDRKKVPELKELHIDIGAKDGEEAGSLVRIGDVGVIDAEPLDFRHGRVVSRSLDNRVGCYVAAEAARLVAESGGAPGDVLALAVTQEETTFAGARTSAFAHEPDVAIVVDLTFATDQPGIELGPITKHPLDSGPVIARGTSLHPRRVRAAVRRRRGRGHRVHARVARQGDRHRRRRHPPEPRRRADRARVGPVPLHAHRRSRWSRSRMPTRPRS